MASTCSEQHSNVTALLEPPELGLPMGLLVSPALVRVVKGTVYVPVVNVGITDVLLFPRRVIGTLTNVNVVSLPPGVTEVKSTSCRVWSIAPASIPTVPGQIDALDLSLLSGEEQRKVRALLVKYQLVFSAFEGDLGCTNIIAHDIPLIDDTPVRQRYRQIPPSEYEVVRAHINQLLDAQVVWESCSPYASPIVLVKKKVW